ncbi:hypothetical protein [Lentibacillus sp. Marseille-P4043]|nr:hypothetical protein [Lentibacillus sp. Marseille-P4043]
MRILLVQPYFDEHFIYQDLYDEIIEIVDKDNQKIDLIVFPEAFSYEI